MGFIIYYYYLLFNFYYLFIIYMLVVGYACGIYYYRVSINHGKEEGSNWLHISSFLLSVN